MSSQGALWYWENKFYSLEYKRAWRLANIERIREQERLQHIKHKETRNAYCRDWYYNNRDERIAQQKKYYQDNKEAIKAKRRTIYQQQRQKNNLKSGAGPLSTH
jgi:hypothetical protein